MLREYFKDRPTDLLVLDITSGEGFENLCRFLDKPVIDEPLPRRNTMSSLQKPHQKLKRFLMRWFKSDRKSNKFLQKLIGKELKETLIVPTI